MQENTQTIDDLQPEGYVPGVCNISPKERKKRLDGFIMSISLSILLIVLDFILPLGAYTLLFFIPLFLASVTFIEWKFSFCVVLAALNTSKTGDKAVKVKKRSDIRDDQIAIFKNFGASFVFATVVTLIIFFLPY